MKVWILLPTRRRAETHMGFGQSWQVIERDVAQTEAQLESVRAQIPQLNSAIELSIHRLSVLTGQQPGALETEARVQSGLAVLPAGEFARTWPHKMHVSKKRKLSIRRRSPFNSNPAHSCKRSNRRNTQHLSCAALTGSILDLDRADLEKGGAAPEGVSQGLRMVSQRRSPSAASMKRRRTSRRDSTEQKDRSDSASKSRREETRSRSDPLS